MSDDLVKRLNERLGSISAPEVFHGDNLAIVLCTAFEDDGEQNENGWTDAAIDGCEQTLQAIRDHYAPLADRIEELEKANKEWAEVSQRNYQRAKKAEAKLAKAMEALAKLKGEKTVAKEWKCPINYPGCKRNCGNYGCGN